LGRDIEKKWTENGMHPMENDDEPMDMGGTLFSDKFILGFFRDAETDLLWKTSIKFV